MSLTPACKVAAMWAETSKQATVLSVYSPSLTVIYTVPLREIIYWGWSKSCDHRHKYYLAAPCTTSRVDQTTFAASFRAAIIAATLKMHADTSLLQNSLLLVGCWFSSQVICAKQTQRTFTKKVWWTCGVGAEYEDKQTNKNSVL